LTDLNVALIMRFVDRATAPARAAAGAVGAMGDRVARAGRAAAVASDRMTAAGNGYLQSAQRQAIGLGAQAAALYALVRPAITAETKLAEIGKVVDFQAPDGLQMLGRDIQNLVTDGGLAMSAAGVADIVAAAGQAGLVADNLPDDERRRQLIEFAEAAGQMGVAFDISAEQSGLAMATWRKAMGLTQAEAIDLGDAINHLSNNTGANAAAMVDVLRRQGAVAASAGLAAEETAALSAALLEAGAAPEVAATALKNFTGAMTVGDAATRRQQLAFRALGLDALDLSQRMQVDAQGAILDVIAALNDLSAEDRIIAVRRLFGEESLGAIMPLIENAGNLANAFELVGDKGRYAGSMGLEYERIAATTEKQLVILRERVNVLATAFGSKLLPMLNKWIDNMGPALGTVTEWIDTNPGFVKALGSAAAGFFALNAIVFVLKGTVGTLLLVLGKTFAILAGIPAAIRAVNAALSSGAVARLLGVGGGVGMALAATPADAATLTNLIDPGLLEDGFVPGTPEWQAERYRRLEEFDTGYTQEQIDAEYQAAMRDYRDREARRRGPMGPPQAMEAELDTFWGRNGMRGSPTLGGVTVGDIHGMRGSPTLGGVTVGDIHVHPTPGMDPAAIAQAVRDEMMRAANGLLHDGGEYADAP
jgi:TP901 family phage tail tape measure protein